MADFSDKPGYAFKPGAPPEVSAYFRNKKLRPSFSWQDVEPEEHAVAFTAAKAMQMDVLETLQGALKEALDQGIPFDQFARDLKPRLRKLGWWGVKEMVDPLTGEARKVRLGGPRRLKTIYRANMRSARAAGQWNRIQRTKRALPYLIYQLGPSENHRAQHEAKAGLVLPVDDPFWRKWYPPNGWGCKCHIRQITRREAEERGVSDSPSIEMRDVVNRRTGEIKRIPVGIDPGWEINPGRYRQQQMERFLAEKLDAADPAIARVAALDMASSWRVRRLFEGTAKGRVPVAMLPEEFAIAIGAKTRVVQIDSRTARKAARRHPELASEDLVNIDQLLQSGIVHKQDATHLHIQSREGLPWVMAIEALADGAYLKLSTIFKADAKRWRGKERWFGERLR